MICHDLAHVETDECGAPEFFSNGTKILHIDGQGGKLDLSEVERVITRRSDIHYPRPKVLSLTQATEVGTVYTPGEIRAASELARHYGLRVQMDGARFANAIAALGVPPRSVTWEVGVDVLCFGGTKNGMGMGEAIVFFNRDLADEFAWRCKQAGQLCSKMRYLAAPWVGLLENGAWLANAVRANAAAARLEAGLALIPGVEILGKREANAVFAKLTPAYAAALRGKGWKFYDFIGAGGCRFMCSWATTDADVDTFLADARATAGV